MTEAALLVQSGTFNVSGNLFTNFRAPINITQNDVAKPIVSGTIAANTFTHVTNRAIWLLSFGGVYPGVTVSGNNFDATGWVNPDWGPAGVVITTGGNNVTANTFTDFEFGGLCPGVRWEQPGTRGERLHRQPLPGQWHRHPVLRRRHSAGDVCSGQRRDHQQRLRRQHWVGCPLEWRAHIRRSEYPQCHVQLVGCPGRRQRPGADKATVGFITSPWNSASGGPCNGGTVPTSKGDCMQGGWQHLVDLQTSPFKSQGDCVSFVPPVGRTRPRAEVASKGFAGDGGATRWLTSWPVFNPCEGAFFGTYCVVVGSSGRSLIHAMAGSAGGVGGLRTDRSGWAA